MTLSCLNFIVLLPTTLFLLVNYYGPTSALQIDPIYLQCNESRKENVKHLSCGIDSRILVEIQFKKLMWDPTIQLNCYDGIPIKFNLPLEQSFPTYADQVKFNSCRFSANDTILEILKNSLQLSRIYKIVFDDNEYIVDFLSRTNLRGLADIVHHLSFTIRNVSTLPTDLFADVENLEILSIYTNSSNSSHISLLLAPLKNLWKMELEINNLQSISRSIFANQIKLKYLTLKSNNITALPSGIFSNLINLHYIYLVGNSFPSKYPEDLSLETKNRKEIHLNENSVGLKELPKGLLRDLPTLSIVKIINCQLDSIPSDTFNGSKNLLQIVIRGNNLQELPFSLFGDQKNLELLDLSRNMIRTLVDGLFSRTTKLSFLNLSDNQLTNLSNDIFKPLTYLKRIILENNNLLSIGSHDNNQLQSGSVFDYFKYLEVIKLKNNSINEIPYNILNFNNKLRNLDLSFNKISSIDCNFVTYLNANINLTGNPINCDCRVLCLHQHIIQKSIQYGFESIAIRCGSPSVLKGRSLYDLKLSEVLCFPDIPQGTVSNRCTYNIRPTDSILVMNCSSGNFNDIPTLPTFDQSFSNGIELIMDNNPLTGLSSKKLKDNANICLLSMNGSLITKFPERFFSNLLTLRNVSLILPLEEIPRGMFDDLTAVTTIKISGTNIAKLPKLFSQYYLYNKNLVFLDLSRNRFKKISEKIFPFESLLRLETLDLSHNFFDSLPLGTLYGLNNLKTLFLNNNCLKYIHPHAFSFKPSLEFLNMENNQLKTLQPFFPLFETLQTLLIRNNSIGNDYFIGIQKFSPYFLDLSSNNISSIDLSHLRSISRETFFFNFSNNNFETIKFTNGNISVNCDCKIISLKKENKQMKVNESLQCLSTDRLKERKIAIDELLCPIISSICPKDCLCWIRPFNSTLIANCSNTSLTEVPRLPELETIFQNGIELSIDNNNLTSLNPHSQSGYKAVTKLFAAHNNITNVFSEDIPENMSYFDVSYNQIERLDRKVIKVINESQTLRTVLLYHNPLICDCSSENLTRFISLNKTLFPDIDQCSDGRKFKTLSYAEFCIIERSNIMLIVISIVIILILVALLFLSICYIKKKEQILIWMYAHKICLCWVTEEEVDKDRKYDAFISYSSLDAHFIREIVSKLESGEKPYKLCLHDRDWLGGGFIPDQIKKSVERSKRTIIVLTENFVKSKWTRLEFRTAHIESLNEKRIRVIVVMVGDVNTDDFDSDLRRYIKMYTYLKWDDPLFWRKLFYSLPHPTKKIDHKKTVGKCDEDAGSEYSSDDNSLL